MLPLFFADTSRPVITFDKPDPTTPQTDLGVTWKSSEDAEFECALDNPNQYEPCGRGRTGGFQRDNLPDGRHRLYVRGKDDVGNVGLPSVYTITTGMKMYKPVSGGSSKVLVRGCWVAVEYTNQANSALCFNISFHFFHFTMMIVYSKIQISILAFLN